MDFEQIIQTIHYYNFLFHLGDHTQDLISKSQFRKKKNDFQLMLLEKYPDQIILEDDGTEGMVLIKLKDRQQNACHFPIELIPMDQAV